VLGTAGITYWHFLTSLMHVTRVWSLCDLWLQHLHSRNSVPLSLASAGHNDEWFRLICSDGFAEYGTMLEICDIKYFTDGRSVVDTVGGRRFRVLERGMREGYHTAKVEFLEERQVTGQELTGQPQSARLCLNIGLAQSPRPGYSTCIQVTFHSSF